MKKHFFFAILLLGFFNCIQAQCIKPPPMTAEQIQKVTGKWKGSYTNNGEKVELEINISAKTGNEVICEINNPPVAGKETMVEYFFCPSGEFHLRKYIGDVSFVFQGIPEHNNLKGTVSVYDNKNKPKQAGHFEITRTD